MYENKNLGNRFVETDSLNGKDPYSASKVGAEAVVSAFRSLNGNESIPKIVSFRAGNVIGGGDWADNRIVPDCVRAWSSGETVTVRSLFKFHGCQCVTREEGDS